MCLALNANAATSGTINLSGNEPAILEITVTAEVIAARLPLDTTVTDLKVGTVIERSNKKAGYTVTINSASASADGSSTASFKSSGSPDTLPYALKYGGKTVSFISGTSAVVSTVSAKTSPTGIENEVTVSFDGANAFLDAEVYGDTLTFTVIAN